MKTLADLRRRMVPGVKVHVHNHMLSVLTGDRTVVRAQTREWCLTLPAGHPQAAEVEGSWVQIPKALDCQFAGGDSVTIASDGAPWLTITFES